MLISCGMNEVKEGKRLVVANGFTHTKKVVRQMLPKQSLECGIRDSEKRESKPIIKKMEPNIPLKGREHDSPTHWLPIPR